MTYVPTTEYLSWIGEVSTETISIDWSTNSDPITVSPIVDVATTAISDDNIYHNMVLSFYSTHPLTQLKNIQWDGINSFTLTYCIHEYLYYIGVNGRGNQMESDERTAHIQVGEIIPRSDSRYEVYENYTINNELKKYGFRFKEEEYIENECRGYICGEPQLFLVRRESGVSMTHKVFQTGVCNFCIGMCEEGQHIILNYEKENGMKILL